jgi:hypothetical protein
MEIIDQTCLIPPLAPQQDIAEGESELVEGPHGSSGVRTYLRNFDVQDFFPL